MISSSRWRHRWCAAGVEFDFERQARRDLGTDEESSDAKKEELGKNAPKGK